MKKVIIALALALALTASPVMANDTADIVWEYLTEEMDLSDACAAGIMGNMMTEAGGQTLSLNHRAKNKTHYGLCQWSKKYYPKAWKASLNKQLKLLEDTIEKEFEVFGKCYKKGFDYEDFKNLKSEKKAARAFAKCYERCGKRSTAKREKNATKALKAYS